MQAYKFNLALKLTNWCNLNCAHCCEFSGDNAPLNVMPIDAVQKHLRQFRELDAPKFEHLVFTGGEAMAPYFHGNYSYIPQCLDAAYKNGFVPFIKTNATWAAGVIGTRILNDLATAAYKYQIMASLDISVDEFHHNVASAANVIEMVMKNSRLTPAIRISLAGLNTERSKYQLYTLIALLKNCGLDAIPVDNMTLAIGYKDTIASVYYDFSAPVVATGRAAINGLGHKAHIGAPDENGQCCLQIDNRDTAILNYKWRTPVAGQPMNTVLAKLISQMERHK